jgi:hypothetical protein
MQFSFIAALFDISIIRLPTNPFGLWWQIPLIGIKITDEASLDPGLTKMRPAGPAKLRMMAWRCRRCAVRR